MHLETFQSKGFQKVDQLYSPVEINGIIDFLQTQDLGSDFGVRKILKTFPGLAKRVFSPKVKQLIAKISPNAQLVRSIYFNKPPQANWIVNWHQDLTINLQQKKTLPGFKNWRVLPERVVVQPPLPLLKNMFTLRIHLDDCTVHNGALRVIPFSHQEGVIDVRHGLGSRLADEVICEIPKGGALLMKPLLLHSSRRSENRANRRVIHIEFSADQLPTGLAWQENLPVF